MKKHFLSVIVAFFAITSVTAQDLQFGISAGVDASRFTISGATGGPLKYRTDLAGGINLEAAISGNFAVQIEAMYTRQGTALVSDNGGTTAGSFQLDYLAFPIVVKFYGSPRLNFFAGPQVGILLSAKSKIQNSPDMDVKEQFKSTDFYAVFGAEYKFANGIFVNARYNLGMTNIVDEDVLPDQEFKNRSLSFRLGYAFKL